MVDTTGVLPGSEGDTTVVNILPTSPSETATPSLPGSKESFFKTPWFWLLVGGVVIFVIMMSRKGK